MKLCEPKKLESAQLSRSCCGYLYTCSHVGQWYVERPRAELVNMASRMTIFSLVKQLDTLYSQHIVRVWKPRAMQVW